LLWLAATDDMQVTAPPQATTRVGCATMEKVSIKDDNITGLRGDELFPRLQLAWSRHATPDMAARNYLQQYIDIRRMVI
jgi:hypothetical protein